MIGQIVNHYAIRSLIGQGRMGWVYLAEHSFIGRRAAIKVVRREFAEDSEVVARFMTDARTVNAIRHRHIIDILDVGRLSDGLPYLLMEYLEGETLGQRLARVGRLSTAEAVAIIGPATSALGAAHGKGIVHRDLKPDNIFLAREPGSEAERVVLLDFGVAKLRDDLSGVASGAAVLGTPAYMSPEQCRGVGEIDARTDVYALGTILYQMLCGRVPFASAGYGDVLLKHLLEPPVPPGALVPEIPPQMEAMILRALAKEPGDRYASVDEAWAALCSATPTPGPVPLSQDLTVTPAVASSLASKPTREGPARAPRGRRFLPRALATTGLMVAVAVWGWSRWQPEAVRNSAAVAAPIPASIARTAPAPAPRESTSGPVPAPVEDAEPMPDPAATAANDRASEPPEPASEPAAAVTPPVPIAVPPASGYRLRPLGPGREPRPYRWWRNRTKPGELPATDPWRRADRRLDAGTLEARPQPRPGARPGPKPQGKPWMEKW